MVFCLPCIIPRGHSGDSVTSGVLLGLTVIMTSTHDLVLRKPITPTEGRLECSSVMNLTPWTSLGGFAFIWWGQISKKSECILTQCSHPSAESSSKEQIVLSDNGEERGQPGDRIRKMGAIVITHGKFNFGETTFLNSNSKPFTLIASCTPVPFKARVLLCSPGYPPPGCVSQAHLEPVILLPSPLEY